MRGYSFDSPFGNGMGTDGGGETTRTDRWDQMFAALAAEPRRSLLFSLLNAPKERRLPLPDAAASSNRPIDPERLTIELRHHHLPQLAAAGYVRWEDDPFCAQRGPHFEEPALILEAVTESVEDIPDSLLRECPVLRESPDDDGR